MRLQESWVIINNDFSKPSFRKSVTGSRSISKFNWPSVPSQRGWERKATVSGNRLLAPGQLQYPGAYRLETEPGAGLGKADQALLDVNTTPAQAATGGNVGSPPTVGPELCESPSPLRPSQKRTVKSVFWHLVCWLGLRLGFSCSLTS